MQNLSGRTIMIVEDDYFVACELTQHFRTAHARVLGPFATVDAALDHAHGADLAVLDLNLRDRTVYPLADHLMDVAIPFVFYSAQDMTSIPRRFAHISRLPKPREARDTVAMLDRQLHEVTITFLLPRLRLSARLILNDPLAADRLVEATLRLALKEQGKLAEMPPLADWLQELMNRTLAAQGRDLMN